MVAAVYTTDLVDIIADMPAATGWTLISSGGGGASSFSVPETDDFIQGANCISRNPWTAISIRGMVYNSAQTVPAGDAVFIWIKADVAQALDTKANGGIQVVIGDATTAFNAYYVDGSDTYAFGGWKCIPIDPTVTQSAVVGAPSATTSFFGARWSVPVSGPSKGFPYKIDAIRRGRIVQSVSGDLANGYATFTALATFGGAITRQWGLFQFGNGVYTQQGLFLMGTAATAVDFRDSNRVIFVAATDFVGSTFNTFEVRNATSRVDWTNITVQSLGTVSRGRFVTTDNATINLNGCTFVDLSTFGFLSSTTITSTTFRRCGLVTQGGATITGSLFTNAQGTALLSGAPDLISNTDFNSVGTGHAIEITTPGTYSFSGNQFTGYSGTGTDAAIYNNSGGAVTLNISGGGGTPTVRNGAGATTVVNNSVSLTLTGIVAGSEVRIYSAGTTTELFGIESKVTDPVFSYSTPESVDIVVHNIAYVYFRLPNFLLASSDSSLPISQVLDRNYRNPV